MFIKTVIQGAYYLLGKTAILFVKLLEICLSLEVVKIFFYSF